MCSRRNLNTEIVKHRLCRLEKFCDAAGEIHRACLAESGKEILPIDRFKIGRFGHFAGRMFGDAIGVRQRNNPSSVNKTRREIFCGVVVIDGREKAQRVGNLKAHIVSERDLAEAIAHVADIHKVCEVVLHRTEVGFVKQYEVRKLLESDAALSIQLAETFDAMQVLALKASG